MQTAPLPSRVQTFLDNNEDIVLADVFLPNGQTHKVLMPREFGNEEADMVWALVNEIISRKDQYDA